MLDHDASHLPHGHFSVVGVGVIVSLDRCEVGIEREEDWGGQALLSGGRFIPQFFSPLDSPKGRVGW